MIFGLELAASQCQGRQQVSYRQMLVQSSHCRQVQLLWQVCYAQEVIEQEQEGICRLLI